MTNPLYCAYSNKFPLHHLCRGDCPKCGRYRCDSYIWGRGFAHCPQTLSTQGTSPYSGEHQASPCLLWGDMARGRTHRRTHTNLFSRTSLFHGRRHDRTCLPRLGLYSSSPLRSTSCRGMPYGRARRIFTPCVPQWAYGS